MEPISFEDVWKEHLTEKAKRIKEERAALDKSDPKYAMKVVALAREEKELEAGFKAFNDVVTERLGLDKKSYEILATSEANKAKAENEAEKIANDAEIERERLGIDKKSLRLKLIFDITALAVSVIGLVHAFMDLFFTDRHFKMATKFEEEDAYLKLSDKAIVQDAIRSDKRHFWNRNR